MAAITIDREKILGPIKPMHGVNNGPLTCNFTRDAGSLFREAGIPFSRLHDTEYPFGSGEFVDFDCVFKCFGADENDPANYNFALTDLYLKAIDDCGARIIYRLGCSIEHNPVKIHLGPPSDYEKWARVAEHIIRHYTEGWADGFRFDIRYWEIWNEADISGGQMWGGTAEEYAEFYAVVATHLKNRFPALKIGGPALCSFAHTEFLETFFHRLTKGSERVPLDFFSWHRYTNEPEKVVAWAREADALLRKYGYEDAESILDEWNYERTWKDMPQAYRTIGSLKGASFDAAVMAALQKTSADVLCYYDAQMKFENKWCGLFRSSDVPTGNGGKMEVVPRKPFYAFAAFNTLYRLGNGADACETALTSDDPHLYGVSATSPDGARDALLFTMYADEESVLSETEVTVRIPGTEQKTVSLFLLDETHDLKKIASFPGGCFTAAVKPYDVFLAVIE